MRTTAQTVRWATARREGAKLVARQPKPARRRGRGGTERDLAFRDDDLNVPRPGVSLEPELRAQVLGHAPCGADEERARWIVGDAEQRLALEIHITRPTLEHAREAEPAVGRKVAPRPVRNSR